MYQYPLVIENKFEKLNHNLASGSAFLTGSLRIHLFITKCNKATGAYTVSCEMGMWDS
jgi:hypothetical protein